VKNLHFRISHTPVINPVVKNFHVPRPARASLADPASRGDAAYGGMPGAFCHGIVKNQQGSAAELLPIGSGGICSSGFHTLP
jgi:hypothetical protein